MANNNNNNKKFKPVNKNQQKSSSAQKVMASPSVTVTNQGKITTKLIKAPLPNKPLYKAFCQKNKIHYVACSECSELLTAFKGFANYCDSCQAYVDVPNDATSFDLDDYQEEKVVDERVRVGRWYLNQRYLGFKNPNGESTELPKLYTELDILLAQAYFDNITTALDYTFESEDEDELHIHIFGPFEDFDFAQNVSALVIFKNCSSAPIFECPDKNSYVSTFCDVDGNHRTVYSLGSQFFETNYCIKGSQLFHEDNVYTMSTIVSTQNLALVRLTLDTVQKSAPMYLETTNYQSEKAKFYTFRGQGQQYILKHNGIRYTPFNPVLINRIMTNLGARKIDANSITLLQKRLNSEGKIHWADSVAMAHILLADQITEMSRWHDYLRPSALMFWRKRPDQKFNEHLEDPFRPKIPEWIYGFGAAFILFFIVWFRLRAKSKAKPASLGVFETLLLVIAARFYCAQRKVVSVFDIDRFSAGTVKDILIYVANWCCFGYQEAEIDLTAKYDVVDYKCRPGIGSWAFGVLFKHCVPVVPRSCTCNAIISITHRMIKKKIEPAVGIYKALFKHSDKVINYNMANREHGEIQPIEKKEWQQHISTNSKRAIARVTSNKLELLKDWRDATTIQAFTKMENTSKFDGEGNYEDFAPRGISSTSPEYLMATGPWGYAISKRLALIWSPEISHIVYGSGLNGDQLGAWFYSRLKRAKCILESDVSRWDGSFSVDALKVQVKIFRNMGVPEGVIRKFKTLYKTHGYHKDGVVYNVDGTVKSGTIITTSGNSLINGLITTYILDCVGYQHQYDSVVNGDDNLTVLKVLMTDDIAIRIKDLWHSFGFSTKIHYYKDPDYAQFCSGRFVPVDTRDGPTRRYIPKDGKLVHKLGITHTQLTKRNYLQHMRGVALGLQKTLVVSPLSYPYILNMLDHSQNVTAEPIIEIHKYYSEQKMYKNVDTISFYEKIYGLSWQHLKDLGNMLRHVKFPAIIDNADWRRIIMLDLNDSFRKNGKHFASMYTHIFERYSEKKEWHIPSLDTIKNLDNKLWYQLFTSCVYAPVSEECFIRKARYKDIPIGTIILIVLETASLMYQGHSASIFLNRCLIHGTLEVLNRQSTLLATIFHAAYNAACFLA